MRSSESCTGQAGDSQTVFEGKLFGPRVIVKVRQSGTKHTCELSVMQSLMYL